MNALSELLIPGPDRARRVELSIVVPVYNEREVLPVLYERVVRVLRPLAINHELLLVDDGSRDGSGEYLVQLALSDPSVKVVRLSRNFGKEAALTAGLDLSMGDAVIILDADLQDPPELIPQMLCAFREGFDVVCMKRRSRTGENRLKRFNAYLYYRFLNRISPFSIPEDTGDFRLMSRRAVESIKQLPERNRYMKGLFAWIGLPTKIISYDRGTRAAGTTKWSFFKLLGLALEGVTSFSVAPLRWVTGIGLCAAILGSLFGAWIVIKTLVLGNAVAGYPSLVAVITFLGGAQLFSIGLLGEYVGKTYFETKQRPVYLIRDVVHAGMAQPGKNAMAAYGNHAVKG